MSANGKTMFQVSCDVPMDLVHAPTQPIGDER